MLKKRIIGIILIVITGCSLIIFVPIQIISIHLSSYSTINEFSCFKYKPSSPSSIEKLYINSDVGNVEIRYIDPPVDYYALIDVNIVLNGQKVAGKSYGDYLNITWDNSSSPVNFRLEIISDDWFNPSLWLIQDVSIIVNLRKDIVFDILTNLTKGNFEITVPYPVSIGSIATNVSNGNILYDFEYCSIQENITVNINEGDLTFKINDVEYAHNNIWDLNVGKGNVNFEIFQNRDMGANITGLIKVNDGRVFILYEDNSADIGAILEIPYGDDFMDKDGFPTCISGVPNLDCTRVHGFDYPHIEATTYEGIVYFTSDDLLTNIVKGYYNIRFEIIQGYFDMNLKSIPFLFE
ncbi:MAG: hypothetical protein ACFFCY_10295 [Promethearchaeota archaeon]